MSVAVSAAARLCCALRALGAQAGHIVRPSLYGWARSARPPCAGCLHIVHRELDIAMALCGATDIDAADTSILTAGEKLLRRNTNLGNFRSRQLLSV